MNLIFYLMGGAIVGYIIEGGVGAFLAGYFISPLLKIGTIQEAFNIPTLLVTLMGAVSMILIVKVVHTHDTEDRPVF